MPPAPWVPWAIGGIVATCTLVHTHTCCSRLQQVVPRGEGAHDAAIDVIGLKASASWSSVATAVRQHLGCGLEAFIATQLGYHAAPSSPVVRTILNILNADRWRAAGYEPRLGCGANY